MAKKKNAIVISAREIIIGSRKGVHRPTKAHKHPKAYNRAVEKSRAKKDGD